MRHIILVMQSLASALLQWSTHRTSVHREGHMILWSPSSTWKSSVSTRSPPVMSGLCLTMRVASHKPGGSSPCCPRSSTSTIESSLMYFTTLRTTFSQSIWPATVVLQVYLLFLDLRKRLDWSDNELEKPCMITAKRLDVLSSTSKENNLLPLINMKQLRSKTL